MKTIATAFVAIAAAVAATPATAQSYDAFTTFNGTQGAGNFYYGLANPATPDVSGTFFTANTNCFIDGSTCLQEAANHDVPGVAKGGMPAFQYGTVNVPQDRLLIHPSNTDDVTFAVFVAPTAGFYRLSATFNVQDINPSGVDIFSVGTTNGGLPLTFANIGSIGAGNTTFTTFTGPVRLGASEALGYAVGRQGTYNNDSTGLQFSVLAGVPEPTTWSLMILGFGAIGGAMRRRARTTTTVAYA
ncbi:PEPxxWA-CTERM sorting domain-containing protein [Sphingomonas sp.]|uniref:PEPxxWA-CTERM sorting domain-containing protein n=1 Tax=Sphingomonas sp. TaxID=28214 RepID=UPI003B00D2E1